MVRRMRFSAIIAWNCLALAGCGLIYPTDVPQDPVELKTNDPFGFAQILTGTTETFTRLNYDELFHPQFEYVASDNRIFSRNEMLEHLRELEADYTNETDSIEVAWKLKSGLADPVFSRESPVRVSRTYTVSMPDSNHKFHGAMGDETFKLEFQALRNSWTILRWEHTEVADPDLFNPEYN